MIQILIKKKCLDSSVQFHPIHPPQILFVDFCVPRNQNWHHRHNTVVSRAAEGFHHSCKAPLFSWSLRLETYRNNSEIEGASFPLIKIQVTTGQHLVESVLSTLWTWEFHGFSLDQPESIHLLLNRDPVYKVGPAFSLKSLQKQLPSAPVLGVQESLILRIEV